MSGKQYAKRDTESMGEHYMRHLDAMTREGLHAKSAIAAELAHRDMLLAQWQRFADHCRSAALSGEHDVLDFKSFVAAM